MTDLGDINYILGVSIVKDQKGMFLSWCKYAIDILSHMNMNNCKLVKTPYDTLGKLVDFGQPVSDPSLYRSLAIRLLGMVLHTLFNKYTCVYLILKNHNLHLLNVYCGMFEALLIMVRSSTMCPFMVSLHILILIGLTTLRRDDPPLDIVFFSDKTFYHVSLNVKILSLVKWWGWI